MSRIVEWWSLNVMPVFSDDQERGACTRRAAFKRQQKSIRRYASANQETDLDQIVIPVRILDLGLYCFSMMLKIAVFWCSIAMNQNNQSIMLESHIVISLRCPHLRMPYIFPSRKWLELFQHTCSCLPKKFKEIRIESSISLTPFLLTFIFKHATEIVLSLH